MLDTELVATPCKIGVNSMVSLGQQFSPEAKPEANEKGPLACHRRRAKSDLWPCWRLLSGPCGCCSPPCGGPQQLAVCAPSQAAQAQATCTKQSNVSTPLSVIRGAVSLHWLDCHTACRRCILGNKTMWLLHCGIDVHVALK